MKNILVTGGAGFIGSHTCVQLLARGYDVYVIDSFANSSPKSLEKVLEINQLKKTNFQNKINIFKGDLLDKDFLNNVFLDLAKTNKKIDGVIHFGPNHDNNVVSLRCVSLRLFLQCCIIYFLQ